MPSVSPAPLRLCQHFHRDEVGVRPGASLDSGNPVTGTVIGQNLFLAGIDPACHGRLVNQGCGSAFGHGDLQKMDSGKSSLLGLR